MKTETLTFKSCCVLCCVGRSLEMYLRIFSLLLHTQRNPRHAYKNLSQCYFVHSKSMWDLWKTK